MGREDFTADNEADYVMDENGDNDNSSSNDSDDGSDDDDDDDDDEEAAAPWTRLLRSYRCQATSTLIDLYQYLGKDDDKI